MNRATAPTNINTRRDILHPDLRVDYRFGVDDTTGIPTGSISGTMAVDTALESQTYDTAGNVYETGGRRLAIVSNSSNGTGDAYPRPLVWARPSAAAQVTWTRSRSGQQGAFWLQSVDFALIGP